MSQSKSSKKAHNEKTAEVLYQRLGNRWYAFSLIDDEVFVGSISQDEIDSLDPQLPVSTPNPGPGFEINN